MPTRYFVQYHQEAKYGKMAYSRGGPIAIHTTKRAVLQSKGGYCFVIAGRQEGKAMTYRLWNYFMIEDIDFDGVDYIASGPGYSVKDTPQLQLLDGWKAFLTSRGNFSLGFQQITNDPFTPTMLALAESSKAPATSDTREELLERLLLLNKKMKGLTPQKVHVEMQRILRQDNAITRLLKEMAGYACQFPGCKAHIATKAGGRYVEAAHIKAVHKGGQSILGNLVVLCPNHHKELDLGVLDITVQKERLVKGTLNGRTFIIKALW